jgi:hypothetical protein
LRTSNNQTAEALFPRIKLNERGSLRTALHQLRTPSPDISSDPGLGKVVSES